MSQSKSTTNKTATRLDSFIRLADRLTEFGVDFAAVPKTDHTIFTLEIHRDELKSQCILIKSAYEDLLMDEQSREVDGSLQTIKAKYQHCYAVYLKCAARINEFKQNLTQDVNPSTSQIARQEQIPTGYNITLPPCDTEIFEGDYLLWPSFRDMFTAIYVNNSRLSSVEKLFHLNKKTKGEAHEIVQKSPITNEGFSQAWTNLSERYENKRVLVNAQLKILFNLPTITKESGSEIKNLQREINNAITALETQGISTTTWDAIIVFLCSTKLPDTTLSLWEHSVQEKTAISTWAELNSFLTSRFQTLETVNDFRSLPISTAKSAINSNRNSSKRINTFQIKVSQPRCILCPQQQHSIRLCHKFLKMPVHKRIELVQKNSICYNCLAVSHLSNSCSSKYSCSTCKGRHHSLLHREKPTAPSSSSSSLPSTRRLDQHNPSAQNPSNPIQSTSSPQTEHQVYFSKSPRKMLLGTALVKICHFDTEYTARALIDPGSEVSFISERIQNRLKLPMQSVNTQVSGLNETIAAKVTKSCDFMLASLNDPHFKVHATALVLSHITGNLPNFTLDKTQFRELPNLKFADVNFYKSDQVDVLIGADLYPSIMLGNVHPNVLGSLIAQESVFGWILTGPIRAIAPTSATIRVSFFNEISIEQQFERFWEVEELPKKQAVTPSDEFCEENFTTTTIRNDCGRYTVTLPFKSSFPHETPLGFSRPIALRQFLKLEERLAKCPKLKQEYDSVIHEYLELGHMQECSQPRQEDRPNHYYLPHHAVIKPESITTKVRVVFNASSPTSSGLSLNDVLHPGPILQNDLTLIILRWRLYKYVFNSDIQMMYRQILVTPEHTQYQRILYRDPNCNQIRDYELKTITFGVNCAPYLAIRTLMQLAKDSESQYPRASHILRHYMYVDDVLVGAHDVLSAITSRDELIAALQSAGFTLRKWTANYEPILANLSKSDLLREDFLKLEDASEAKMLGIRWNAKSDNFYFHIKTVDIRPTYSKREILSTIAKLFDPIGWLGPIIITAKILMQDIWLEKIGWDEKPSTSILKRWIYFLENYTYIEKIRIPRWIRFSPWGNIEFHAFCDASQKAYAGTIYARVEIEHQVKVFLAYSKTRVAPIKTISLPRLELCGATLVADMIDSLLPNLHIEKYNVYCWTDSTIVLAWLKKHPCHWTTFVANRVSKITEKVNSTQWFHVDSNDNPADLASRGIHPKDLVDNSLWWSGPQWLQSDRDRWPRHDNLESIETTLEQKSAKTFFTYFPQYDDLLERFSSFSRALRVLSYVLRFFYRTHSQYKTTFVQRSVQITSQEIADIRNRVEILAQKTHFPNEYYRLENKKEVEMKSSLLTLNPFLHSDGTLRVGGRLSSCPDLPFNERHPIILPYHCHYTKLLVQFTHMLSLHGGNQLVLRLLRMQYWIPRVKNLIKTTIHQCRCCVLFRKRQQTQIMGSLPAARTVLTRPFTTTGIDFCGPFNLKSYSGRACRMFKGYVCLFVCFSTKAIHLEPTTDLSTSVFLAAFSRFTSRRGCPSHIYSDNGTNLVGASREVQQEYKRFMISSSQSIVNQFSHQKVSWHFIPAGAPHMGGLWEAGVKSFKAHFRKIAGEFQYTLEEFSTLLCKIEACLNSRPLSPMSENPTDLQALSPGHFLIGGPLLAPAEPEITDSPMSMINRWLRVKALNQHFCRRWKTEYLKELYKRNKWKTPQPNLKVDDLVVVREDNLPTNSWRLGRITRVYRGGDNHVRVADIRTQRGYITRPITKLVVLPS